MADSPRKLREGHYSKEEEEAKKRDIDKLERVQRPSSSFYNWRLYNTRRGLCHTNAGNIRTVIIGATA